MEKDREKEGNKRYRWREIDRERERLVSKRKIERRERGGW